MKIRGKNSGFGEINMKVKTRQQGNSVVLTVPKTLNVPVDAEFSVDLKKNGDLVYKRVRDNRVPAKLDSQFLVDDPAD